MANPIKTSDLLLDDGAIRDMIDQFKQLSREAEQGLDGVRKEAKALEKELDNLNATTVDQRDAVKVAADQTAEIEKRYQKYTESLNENAVQIAALKNAQTQINQVNKLQAKLATSLEGSYNALSAQYSLNKIRLNQMSAEQRKTTAEGKKLEAETKNIREEMKRLQEATGSNVLSVGDYGRALENLPGPIGFVVRDIKNFRDGLVAKIALLKASTAGLTGTAKALQIFKVALISTGIGAIVVAIGSLVALLTRTQRGLDFVARTAAGVGAVFSVLTDRAAKLGVGILLMSQNVQLGMSFIRQAVTGIGKEITEEFDAATRIEGAFQGIREESRALRVETAETRAEIKRLNLIAEDTTKGHRERAGAAQEAFNLEKGLLEKREGLVRREIAAIRERNALGESTVEDLDELADKQVELANIQEQSLELQTTINNKLNTINQQAREAQRRHLEELEKMRIDKLKMEQEQSKQLVEAALAAVNRAQVTLQSKRDEQEGIRDVLIGFFIGPDTPLSADDRLKKIADDLVGGIDVIKENIKKRTEKEKPEDLFDLLGFDFREETKTNIRAGFDFFKEQLIGFANLRAEIAARNVASANSEVAAAEEAVRREIAERNAGFAHKLDTAQRELAQARANQKRALDEQAKARKAQLVAQAVEQASNLITGASKIIAQLGFFAAPAVAFMFASFIAAQIRARKLARLQAREGHFEVLGGKLHEQGGTPLGYTSDGRILEAERDEALAIFSRKATRRNTPARLKMLVDAINKGQVEVGSLNLSQAHRSDIHIQPGPNIDNTTMERELTRIRKNSEYRYHRDQDGNLVEQYKNRKRTYVSV